MEIANKSLPFNAHLMAIVNTIKVFVEAGNNFSTDMTADDAAIKLSGVVHAYSGAPTWFFKGPDEAGATSAHVTTACTVFHMGLVDEPNTLLLREPMTPRDDDIDIRTYELERYYIKTYVHGCRVGLEWPTCCATFPRVPRLFRVDDDGKFTFDDWALREFVDSLPADAYLSLWQQRRAAKWGKGHLLVKSTDKALTGKLTGFVLTQLVDEDTRIATLFYTLRRKFGLSGTDTRDLIAAAPLLKLSRDNIKDVAQYVAENPDTAVIDRLIVVASDRHDIDHDDLMASAAADGWTSDDFLEFVATVVEDYGYFGLD